MKIKSNLLTVLCVLPATLYQHAATAATDYIVTGSFYGDQLLVTEYDEISGEETYIDAFLNAQPLNLSSSPSFTLSFTVDDDAEGHVPLFANVALFDNAVSAISLDINGNNVLTENTTETIQQFPGDNGIPARWSWSLFSESFALPILSVFNALDNEFLTDLSPSLTNFALYDSTQQVYGAGFPLDLIGLDLAQFDDSELSLFWDINYSEEGPEGNFSGEAFYQVFGTIDSITAVSEVPLPAAAWLFMSALGGLFVTNYRHRR